MIFRRQPCRVSNVQTLERFTAQTFFGSTSSFFLLNVSTFQPSNLQTSLHSASKCSLLHLRSSTSSFFLLNVQTFQPSNLQTLFE